MPSLKTKKQKMKRQENTKNVRDKFGASKVWYLFTLVPDQVQPRKKAPKGKRGACHNENNKNKKNNDDDDDNRGVSPHFKYLSFLTWL